MGIALIELQDQDRHHECQEVFSEGPEVCFLWR